MSTRVGGSRPEPPLSTPPGPPQVSFRKKRTAARRGWGVDQSCAPLQPVWRESLKEPSPAGNGWGGGRAGTVLPKVRFTGARRKGTTATCLLGFRATRNQTGVGRSWASSRELELEATHPAALVTGTVERRGTAVGSRCPGRPGAAAAWPGAKVWIWEGRSPALPPAWGSQGRCCNSPWLPRRGIWEQSGCHLGPSLSLQF